MSNEWQPIATCIPDNNTVILAWVSRYVLTVMWDEDGWMSAETGAIVEPTHWQPLPEGPKGEGK